MPIWLQVIALVLAVIGTPINVACVIFTWRAAVDVTDARDEIMSEVTHHGR